MTEEWDEHEVMRKALREGTLTLHSTSKPPIARSWWGLVTHWWAAFTVAAIFWLLFFWWLLG